MDDDQTPLDADQLMNFAERIERLPEADREWVDRLFRECLRARMNEADLLSAPPGDGGDLAAQMEQVALDAADWLRTLWDVGYMGAGSFPSPPRSAFPQVDLEDVHKSALFARIRDGKRPLPFPPPTRNGLPWHDLVDSQGEAHEVAAQIVRDDSGRPIAAIIAACADWGIVEEVLADHEYLVQHRAKGPLFRLRLGAAGATLGREPPRWTRRIRLQQRGGFRSYTLEWEADAGGVQNIPLRAATWERAESEAAYWVASQHPQMYGQVSFERVE